MKYLHVERKFYFSKTTFICSYILSKCKEDLNRPKYAVIYFTLSEKKGLTIFKRTGRKEFFSSVYIIGTTCFDECFLIYH